MSFLSHKASQKKLGRVTNTRPSFFVNALTLLLAGWSPPEPDSPSSQYRML